MPRKSDSIAIKNPFLDRRRKLLPCQEEMVVYWYKVLGVSITKIAKDFKVNKRLIQFLLFPERKKRNVELRLARVGTTGYYNKDEHTAAIREHRDYKKKLKLTESK